MGFLAFVGSITLVVTFFRMAVFEVVQLLGIFPRMLLTRGTEQNQSCCENERKKARRRNHGDNESD